MGAGRGSGGAARWGGAGGGAGRGSGPPRRGLGRQCRRRVRAPDPAVSAERAGRAGVGVCSSPGLGRGRDPRSPRGWGTWPRAEPGEAPGRDSATAGPRAGSGPRRPRLGRAGPGEWAQRPREPAPPAGGWRAARRRGRGAPRPLVLPGPTQRLGAQPLLPAPPPPTPEPAARLGGGGGQVRLAPPLRPPSWASRSPAPLPPRGVRQCLRRGQAPPSADPASRGWGLRGCCRAGGEGARGRWGHGDRTAGPPGAAAPSPPGTSGLRLWPPKGNGACSTSLQSATGFLWPREKHDFQKLSVHFSAPLPFQTTLRNCGGCCANMCGGQ